MKEIIRSNIFTFLQAIALVALLFLGLANATDIVIIYAIETILIGIFHVIKMLIITFNSKSGERGSGIGLTLFFMVHYGFFTFIQTTFFFVFLSMSDRRISDDFGLGNFFTVLHFEGVQISAAIFILVLIYKLFANFIQTGAYKKMTVQESMFIPYPRIFVQQFVAIIPGFFIILFDAGLVVAIVLIVFRTGLDIAVSRMKSSPENMDKAVKFVISRSKEPEKSTANESEIRRMLTLIAND